LQHSIAANYAGKPSLTWDEFKSFAQEGRP